MTDLMRVTARSMANTEVGSQPSLEATGMEQKWNTDDGSRMGDRSNPFSGQVLKKLETALLSEYNAVEVVCTSTLFCSGPMQYWKRRTVNGCTDLARRSNGWVVGNFRIERSPLTVSHCVYDPKPESSNNNNKRSVNCLQPRDSRLAVDHNLDSCRTPRKAPT